MQGARRSEAGFTLPAAQRGSVPGAAHTGGAQRPPEGRLWPVQVSHTSGATVINTAHTVMLFYETDDEDIKINITVFDTEV